MGYKVSLIHSTDSLNYFLLARPIIVGTVSAKNPLAEVVFLDAIEYKEAIIKGFT